MPSPQRKNLHHRGTEAPRKGREPRFSRAKPAIRSSLLFSVSRCLGGEGFSSCENPVEIPARRCRLGEDAGAEEPVAAAFVVLDAEVVAGGLGRGPPFGC